MILAGRPTRAVPWSVANDQAFVNALDWLSGRDGFLDYSPPGRREIIRRLRAIVR